MNLVTKQLRIHGKVQGVFFRESMRQKALALNVTGWVRNRQDGTVEAIIQGKLESVEKLIKWAHLGPESAQVTRVEINKAEGYFEYFEKQETI